MSFFETSAKTNKNVTEVFYHLTKEILKANEGNKELGGKKLTKTDNSKEGKRRCCKWEN